MEQVADFFRDPLVQGVLTAIGASGVLYAVARLVLRRLWPRPATPSCCRPAETEQVFKLKIEIARLKSDRKNAKRINKAIKELLRQA